MHVLFLKRERNSPGAQRMYRWTRKFHLKTSIGCVNMMMQWARLLNKNRMRASTLPGDHREEFERDFDRVAFSTPVKRMQDKTQVFPLEPHDAVRTRLTHSLEVSSVARGLAIAVAKWLTQEGHIQAGMDRQIEAIAATCGLLHDLGNPPFGHAGEEAIQNWFNEKFNADMIQRLLDNNPQLVADFRKFESNAQTLRLVMRLQILADFHGLNLTYGTLSALCRYTAPSHEAISDGDHAKEKPGYFASEAKLVRQIRETTGTGDARNPITFLVEAADDISYSAADIEDSVKKGIFRWEFMEKLVKEERSAPVEEAFSRKDKILKAGRTAVPTDLEDDIHASAFRTAAIGVMVESVVKTFTTQYENIMNGTYRGELVKDGTAEPLIRQLKKIGREYVYCTPPTLKLELMGRHVIVELLNLFWEGAQKLPVDGPPKTIDFSGKLGALLSENYMKVFRHFVKEMPELPEGYHRLQLVTDYVCGMTDSFAKRLHAELTNG